MKPSGPTHAFGARVLFPWLISFLLWCAATAFADQTNIYSTSFETSEGYDPAYELIGQKNWVGYGGASGGNGLLTNFLGQQAAYVGSFPLSPPSEFLSVWQPLPNLTTRFPIVKFSVLMAIEDSTYEEWDDFYWSVYNQQGDRLFTLDFDNYGLGVYYLLDGTNQFVYTGVTFTNDIPYTLTLTMDFSTNSWSASLDGVSLATNKPITTTRAPLTLGDIDAVWAIYSTNAPGDNFMVFDHYQVIAQTAAAPAAMLTPRGHTSDGLFALRLNSASGARFAIEATTNWTHWTALKTNTVTDGFFDFVDADSPFTPDRFYRARYVP